MTVSREEFDALEARVDAIESILGIIPDPEPDLALSIRLLGKTSDTITIAWDNNPTKSAVASSYGRDGTDTQGTGPWTSPMMVGLTDAKFDHLLPNTWYTLKVKTQYADTTTEDASILVQTLPKVVSPPIPIPPGNVAGVNWRSGVWAMHDRAQEALFASLRKRPIRVGAAFMTWDTSSLAEFENMWPMGVTGAPEISLGVPMALRGQFVQTQDLSPSMTKIAQGIKADGRLCYVRLGWEMNLKNNSRVTDSNLTVWRQRWTKYYDIFKSICGDQALVGFNPNDGPNQSGLSGSIMKAWVAGKVDWCGPDVYDWWPAFNSSENIANHWDKDQGLNWWARTAREQKVRLAVPEWGGTKGTSAGVNAGGDNPKYIDEMYKFFKREEDNLLYEAYFNEKAVYLMSDLTIPQLPSAAARYRDLWRPVS